MDAGGSRRRPPVWLRRRVLAGVAAAVAGTLVVATVVLPRVLARPATRRSAEPGQLSAAVEAVLVQRDLALRQRQESAFLGVVDPAEPTFLTAQRRLWHRLVTLPLAGWNESVVRVAAGASTGPGAPAAARTRSGVPALAAAAVEIRYRLAGVDRRVVVVTERDVFRSFRGRWLLAGEEPAAPGAGGSAGAGVGEPAAPGAENLWQLGAIRVLRRGTVVVIAAPSQAALAGAALVATLAGLPRVTRVWGPGWARAAAVELPATQSAFAALTALSGGITDVAAVTLSDAPGGRPGGPGERIVVNPAAFARLSALGQRVVLTHELTHVASAGVTGPTAPRWLVEGFADFVAFRGSGLPIPVAAAELAAEVRGGRLPAALPSGADFDQRRGAQLAATYEEAWLACRLIAARVGTGGLVQFYRAVAPVGEAALPGQLQRELGTSVAGFVAQWRATLRAELAGSAA